MLAAALLNSDSPLPAVITGDVAISWKELGERIAKLVANWQELGSQRIGLCLPADAEGIAALAALDKIGAHVYLIDEHASNTVVAELADRFRLARVLQVDEHANEKTSSGWKTILPERRDSSNQDVDPPLDGSSDSRQTNDGSTVTVLTSGTEGIPKAATYTWTQLAKPVRILTPSTERAIADVWLLTFRIHLYAGLQVMLQALLNQQTLVVPGTAAEPDDILRMMVEHQVSCASATPSYWRRLALFGDRSLFLAATLRQITLGGELADQPILDTLRAAFPQARLSHIYATTELGRCFAVTDGLAGFPCSYLAPADEKNSGRAGHQISQVNAQLRIKDGQLFVRSVNGSDQVDTAAEATEDRTRVEFDENPWVATGDLVEVVGDRVHFAGRSGDMINVGGNKVRPAMVEAIIRGVEGVADVRVFGKASSIAGQLVACEMVVMAGTEPMEVKHRVQASCREQLAPYQMPRSFDIVAKIEISQAGKTLRQPVE